MRFRLALLTLLPTLLAAQQSMPPAPWPPVATFSVLGHDLGTGEAAMLIVKKDAGVWPPDDAAQRLQVDDDPTPIAELGRLVDIAARQREGTLRQPRSGDDRFVGDWMGVMRAGAVPLRLALIVRRDSAGALGGALVSLDQGNARRDATVTIRGDTLVAVLGAVGARYAAVINAGRDTLAGAFTQGPATFPLVMTRATAAAVAGRRPQDPTPPFPYTTTDVTFSSAPRVTLAGTLTVPNGPGPFPAVVLVTGSGPQNRDEELMGHRPFAVIADHLARHGIATLRYDDRGIGKSAGDFATATSADFAEDAEAAVRWLRGRKEIARDRVGIMGHSEGGLIAPMVAARSRDVAFVVLLAGPGLPGDSILMLQSRALLSASGAPAAALDRAARFNRAMYDAVKSASDPADAAARAGRALDAFVASLPQDQRAAASASLRSQIAPMTSPWMHYFLTYDPRPTLTKLRVPVLALDGTLDLQVPYKESLAAIDSALTAGGNRDHTEIALPGLNHLFQHARTGLVDEYAAIDETVSPEVLDTITQWITKRFANR